MFDVLTYIPIAFMMAVTIALLFRHFFHWKSTDMDVATGTFNEHYRQLPPNQRAWLVVIQMLGYLLCASIIAASIISKLISP